jgi:hypothetical protein
MQWSRYACSGAGVHAEERVCMQRSRCGWEGVWMGRGVDGDGVDGEGCGWGWVWMLTNHHLPLTSSSITMGTPDALP